MRPRPSTTISFHGCSPKRRRSAWVTSVPSQWFATQFPGEASRLAALLLAQILPVSSLVAPCDPGAAPGTSATIHWDGTTLAPPPPRVDARCEDADWNDEQRQQVDVPLLGRRQRDAAIVGFLRPD